MPIRKENGKYVWRKRGYDLHKKDDQIKFNVFNLPKPSKWKCYLFGNRPGQTGIVWQPNEGGEPNWFVRWMMKVCFDCLWIKDES